MSYSGDPAQAKYDFLDSLEERGVKPRIRQRIDTIIEYLAQPSNTWPEVKEYTTELVDQKDPKWFYRLLDQEEREQVEAIGLAIRRTRFASVLSEIDQAVIDHAKSGSARHADLAYRRFEGWSPSGGKQDNAAEKKNR